MTANPYEYKWCAIDAEGDSGKRGLMGVAFYSDKFQAYLTNHVQIKEYLEYHAEEGYTFLIHNAAYDIPVIFFQLGIPVKAIYYNARFNRGEWKYHKRKRLTQIWDTLGLSGLMSLHDLGKALNCPKYDTPESLSGDSWSGNTWHCDKHTIEQCIECYAIRDAEIIYRFMTDFTILLAGWGCQPQRRLAGNAMNVWKTLDPRESINIRNKQIDQLGRESYHGGRVDCFKLGHVMPAYTADVASMYPAMMLRTRLPEPASMIYREDVPVDSVDWWLEGVANVTVNVPSMYIPPLVYDDNGVLKYPVGTFRGTWTFLELRHAMAIGCKILSVHRISWGAEFVKPFDNFINVLWTLREEYKRNNDPRTLFAKILMNNLYGRIGMKQGLEQRNVMLSSGAGEPPKNGYRTRHLVGDRITVEDCIEQHYGNKWSNVIWASYITAAARCELHTLLMQQGHNIVYCDTDSIFSMSPIVGLGNGLGSLRDEHMLQWVYVAQPKLYSYKTMDGNKIARAKGVPRHLAEEFIQEGKVVFDAPVSMLDMKRRGIMAGTWIEVKRERQRTPHRRNPLRPVSELGQFEYTDTVPPVID